MRHLFAASTFLLMAITMTAVMFFGEAGDARDRDELEQDGVVRECGDFPGSDMDMAGILSLARPIACAGPVIIRIKEVLIVRSYDHIKTSNMHFVVDSGGSLTFKTKRSVLIQRDEASTVPLLDIDDGTVKIEAGGWFPDHANGSTEDDGGVVDVKEGGSLSVNSQAKIVYTSNSIMAADTSRQHDEGDADRFQPVPYKDTELFARTERFQEYLRSVSDTPADNGNLGLPPSPLEAASSNSPIDEHNDITSKPDKASLFSPKPPSPEHSGSPQRSTIPVPKPNNPSFKGAPSAKPRPSELSVDTVLTGKLSTDDSLAAVWADYDGAVVLGKRPYAPAEGEQVPFAREKVLISPWSRKVYEVDRARALLRNMEADADTKNSRGFGWTKKEIKRAKTVREHQGEIKLVVTNRGCVTVTMDGICVMERSGRFTREWMNRFPWRRRKNDRYALRATKDGLEVVHEERKVWGISVGKLS